MKVGIQASKGFNDYPVFMRAMGVALSPLRDNPGQLTVYSAGPVKLNNFITGFVNLSEDGMKNRGMSIKLYKVSLTWMGEHLEELDYFAYMSRPKEPWSSITHQADRLGIEVGIFRY
jgi:hypothetical protein